MGETYDTLYYRKSSDEPWQPLFEIPTVGFASVKAAEPGTSAEAGIKPYARMISSQTLSGTIEIELSKKFYWNMYLWMPSKRVLRRAYRWYEKLRRGRLKGTVDYRQEDLIYLAAQCARTKLNCGKRRAVMERWVFNFVKEQREAIKNEYGN